MKTLHKIILGDSRQMTEIHDDSVHLVVTSPPYWQLKDYGTEDQIGFNHSYEQYINHLNLVWNECYRILHKSSRLCINIGDQFARSVYYGRYKIIPIRTEIIKFCETIGFDYMGAIIWQKVTTCNTTGGATVMGSYPYPRNGILKLDYEFILIFKKPGNTLKVSKEIKKQSIMTKDEWNEYFSGHWNFSGERQDKHLAMFPEELPRRLIKMFTFVGETVLDPFLGSGTTSLAAKNLNRNSIGYEINQEFLSVIKKKLSFDQENMFKESDYKIINQMPIANDFQHEIKQLPYIFHDPVQFDKKMNVKKRQFGSKIDKNHSEREQYYTLREIITPEQVILNDNLKVRLIGVKEKPDTRNEAIQFLKHKTKGQKLYLRLDPSISHENKDQISGYLYLKNRTFLNAHLIKNKLVDIDLSYNYKYKSNFLSIQHNLH